jgi:hypothetical protein
MPSGKGARERRRLNRLGLQQTWSVRSSPEGGSHDGESHEPEGASVADDPRPSSTRPEGDTDIHLDSSGGAAELMVPGKFSAGMKVFESWGEANHLQRAPDSPGGDAGGSASVHGDGSSVEPDVRFFPVP